ncbi:MAG: tRNA (Guanine37-N1) -methyltransferase (EC [uncultured Thiotrichaceae bacterium]|uniref:tRNA (guanine-N(1)-)-methyltransferase n=1 Tax=uncultured Thiotrichaceae bacterium TaxID=298394 RepID=A0A6S6SGT2_9GAMM|nr:MAG: tRNA (Guanine37-N1) -methyltransferase (EC [uncultured Thiotrichaceae bacterium]
MRFDVITLFPEMVQAVVNGGVTGRAADRELIHLNCINPRDFTTDVHRTVDDRPYGGGPGMVMKPDCLVEAIRSAKSKMSDRKVIYLSPQGKTLNQSMLQEASKSAGLILLCGRYEGIDERVLELDVDEEWSLGDYVLSGGELGAMVIVDGITRLLPSVLGHSESANQDSFSDGLLDCPHYTRPEKFEGLSIPAVLKSGNHQEIERWRKMQALGRTFQKRPDLLDKLELTEQDKILLDTFLSGLK